MNTYTWHIENLEVAPLENGLTDVVKKANFWVEAVSNDGIKAQHHAHVSLPTPSSENFTAYANITEENVLSWIRNTSSGVLSVEEILDEKIEQIRTPPLVEKDLPWTS